MRTSYEQCDKWWCAQCGTRCGKAEAFAINVPRGGGTGTGTAQGQGGTGGSAAPRTQRTPTEALDLLSARRLGWDGLVRAMRHRYPDDAVVLDALRRTVAPDGCDTIDRVLAGGDP